MTLSKYKLSLLAAANAECENSLGDKGKIVNLDFSDGDIQIGVLTEETKGYVTTTLEDITPIMRSIDQITEEEKEAFAEIDGVGIDMVADLFSWNEIVWLLDIGVWYDKQDFTDNLIQEKKIKEKA